MKKFIFFIILLVINVFIIFPEENPLLIDININIGIKIYVDAPMEVWFSNIMLGKINPDNWLVESEFNNEKVVFKT